MPSETLDESGWKQGDEAASVQPAKIYISELYNLTYFSGLCEFSRFKVRRLLSRRVSQRPTKASEIDKFFSYTNCT
jgi:hypothetical protein